MSKMFVFAIGGSGSRVLKSLTMLLAAGVKCNVDTIVPIIIDKDVTGFKETKDLVESYIKVQKYAPKSKSDVGAVKNRFFKTKLEFLDNSLVMQLESKSNKFKDHIYYDDPGKINNSTKKLVDVLFSKKTLEMSTSVGFQGNPNVGSVVLNQFNKQKVFKTFGQEIDNEDKIFIISSIFGGTGASGFPILLKTLNNPPRELGLVSPDRIKNAPKGAITILPYFKVSSEKDENNKDSLVPKSFIPGTKAALHYYKTLDRQIDTLYYIGEPDALRPTYKHEKGGSNQEKVNTAHIVELFAAMSIIDFANNPPSNRDSNNNITETTYKEFGVNPKVKEGKDKRRRPETIANDGKIIGFNDLADDTKELLKKPLTQLLLTRKYIHEKFETEKQPYLKKLGIDTDFFKGDSSMKAFVEFLSKYNIYLDEIESGLEDKRKFSPFSLKSDDPFKIFRNETVKAGIFEKKGWNWIINNLNKEIDKVVSDITDTQDNYLTERRIVELFYRATEQFYERLIKK